MNDTLASLKCIKVKSIDVPCGNSDYLHIKLYSEAENGEIRIDTDDGIVVYAYDELNEYDTFKLFMDYFGINGLRIEYSSKSIIDNIDPYLFLGLILLMKDVKENRIIEDILSCIGLGDVIDLYRENYKCPLT